MKPSAALDPQEKLAPSHFSNVEFHGPSWNEEWETCKYISEAGGSQLCTLEMPRKLPENTHGWIPCPEAGMKRAGAGPGLGETGLALSLPGSLAMQALIL